MTASEQIATSRLTDGACLPVQIRPLPYPYRAMMAICSDLDETTDRQVYWEIARFLNTDQPTAIGRGVGLEVGNSIYFDMPPGQFAYWNTDDAGRRMVQTMIRSGHIDCLHSYGDLAGTRQHAQAALDELARHNCRLEVWVDHAISPTNFGSDIMHGHGDMPNHEAYHADLTIAYGIRYISRGRVTSILGQDVHPETWQLLQVRHPLVTGQTFAKEQAKRMLGRLGHPKYDIHVRNEVLRAMRLRDGSTCYEFLRCNPCEGGVSASACGREIGRVLTSEMVNRFAQVGGLCVLYTHLGKIHRKDRPFDESAIQGFLRLSQAQRAGLILTTTTRRLLGYALARREAVCKSTIVGDARQIDIRTGCDAIHCLRRDDLAGLTFYVDSRPTSIFIDGVKVKDLVFNDPDETGRASVSLPWRRLEFPSQ